MNEHLQKKIEVTSEFHHQRIDSLLAQLIPEFSRSQISHWIKAGFVQIDQKPCKPKDKVQSGNLIQIDVQFIRIDPDFKLCEPEALPLSVIFEDEDLLVLNKPAGLVVHPGAGNKEHTLVNALLHHEPNLNTLPRAGIIHRLDKDTTGLLIVAKSLTAHTALIRQMQDRLIQRHYLALVEGVLISGGLIETCFGRHPRNRLKMSVKEQGRQATTYYEINKKYQDFTLLNLKLMTGRTHQIRVHLAHIRHPVVGDPLYNTQHLIPKGCSLPLKEALTAFKRQALHACSLSFHHPKSEQELHFTAPLPEDFQSLLYLLDEEHNGF